MPTMRSRTACHFSTLPNRGVSMQRVQTCACMPRAVSAQSQTIKAPYPSECHCNRNERLPFVTVIHHQKMNNLDNGLCGVRAPRHHRRLERSPCHVSLHWGDSCLEAHLRSQARTGVSSLGLQARIYLYSKSSGAFFQ